MTYHYPTPDAQGIAETKALFERRFGRTPSEEEAYRVLFAIMRFLYLINTQPPPMPAATHDSSQADD